MSSVVTDEQQLLRETVARVLADRTGHRRRGITQSRGHDEQVWAQLCELGVVGVHLPEEVGGQGASLIDLALVIEELGREVSDVPLLASAGLAAPAMLEAADEEQRSRLLPSVAQGDRVAALAWTPTSGVWDPRAVEVIATPGGRAHHQVSGETSFVLAGAEADLLIVAARAPESRGEDGVSLLAVDANDPGVRVVPLQGLDLTRRQAKITFERATAELLGEPGTGVSVLTRVLDQATALLTCEMVGGAQTVLDEAVAYAGTRQQFGRPIGSFQAVKHQCADMLLDVESARSAAQHAIEVAVEGHEEQELAVAVSVAKAWCSEAYPRSAAAGIQVHGGIGFTWEHDAHLYYRRAMASALLFGDARHHRSRLARLLGLTAVEHASVPA